MPTIEHTQTVTDFHRFMGETLDKINHTGEAQILVENGQARAVVLSPTVYDAMRDAVAIQRSRQDIAQGRVYDIDSVSAEIRANVLAGKANREDAG